MLWKRQEKPPGTRHFAIIQGFIPETHKNKFRDLTKDFMSVFDQTGDNDDNYTESSEERLPSLLTNKRYINTFEVITETQGLPRYDEVDPTPIIAFVWPLFYGIMFADLGHGLLLFGLGMLLRQKGEWIDTDVGLLIAAGGNGFHSRFSAVNCLVSISNRLQYWHHWLMPYLL